MLFSPFCLSIATIVLLVDAIPMSGRDIIVLHTKLYALHVQFEKSAKAKGFLLTVMFNVLLCFIFQFHFKRNSE
jgi:hypothetical protein